MESEKGRSVKAHYLSVARHMRSYSAELHGEWNDAVAARLVSLLRQTVLVQPREVPTQSGPLTPVDLSSGGVHEQSDVIINQQNHQWFISGLSPIAEFDTDSIHSCIGFEWIGYSITVTSFFN